MIPDDLTAVEAEALYALLDDLTSYRQTDGRGRSEEATYVRDYCETERERVKVEIRRRGLPGTRANDTRIYGPGQAAWQRAGTAWA